MRLADSGGLADLPRLVGVIVGEGGIDTLLVAAEVRLVDRVGAGIGDGAVPETEADDLEVDGLDVGAEDRLGRAVGSLDADAAQVVHQPARGLGGDREAAEPERPLERLAGGRGVEQVEAEAAGQPARDAVEVGLERGDVLLAHGEQRPEARVFQQASELIEERFFRGDVRGIGREDLLELVEDQHEVRFAAIGRGAQSVGPLFRTREPVRRDGPGARAASPFRPAGGVPGIPACPL